eukprot:gnl/TRDRNA2_/TRDRNA2_143147_c0_seq1.p1 gnl/TRDRNA2_/TRDRNA2_143147_c0~~gnl/TRDRNA2_/TRDRNA2_143147_c0_seq1.p1  ORF type:complete len:228 (-),score=58.41 gnl/TRDRNA2_/TRDRNA2_143147_c0_seq1:55-738(-)
MIEVRIDPIDGVPRNYLQMNEVYTGAFTEKAHSAFRAIAVLAYWDKACIPLVEQQRATKLALAEQHAAAMKSETDFATKHAELDEILRNLHTSLTAKGPTANFETNVAETAKNAAERSEQAAEENVFKLDLRADLAPEPSKQAAEENVFKLEEQNTAGKVQTLLEEAAADRARKRMEQDAPKVERQLAKKNGTADDDSGACINLFSLVAPCYDVLPNRSWDPELTAM